jgi:hypothetical protein
VAFVAAAAGSSLLALVNGPVGPSGYSPRLAELRTELPPGSVVVLAPESLLEAHGRDYLAWELRGNRVCVIGQGEARPPGAGVVLSVAVDDDGAVVPGEVLRSPGAVGPGPCPLIPDAARADPGGAG